MRKIILAIFMMLFFAFLFMPQQSMASVTADVKFTKVTSELFDESQQAIVTVLPKNEPVLVLEQHDGWLKVQYKTQIGYIKDELVTAGIPQYLLVKSKDAPLVRITDSQQSATIGTLHINSIIEVYPVASEQFVFVRYGHLAGYVYKQALVKPIAQTRVVKDPNGVTVYSIASKNGTELGTLYAKSEVTMLTNFNGWAFVTTDTFSGYIMANNLGYKTDSPRKKNEAKTKKIALTFDDGPHPKVTHQILNTLEKYNAKATFFVVGTEVKKNPKVLKAVADAGHEIGNHTYNHAKLTTLPINKIKTQINTTDAEIKAAIGRNATVFRPPYGAYDSTITKQLKVPNVLWTIDTLDWLHHSPTKTVDAVQKNAKNGSIVLMHDIHQTTADALELILETLQKQGYEFVTVSEILKK